MANSYRMLLSAMIKDDEYITPEYPVLHEFLTITLTKDEYELWQDFYLDVRGLGEYSLQLSHAEELSSILWCVGNELTIFDGSRANFYGEVPNEWIPGGG